MKNIRQRTDYSHQRDVLAGMPIQSGSWKTQTIKFIDDNNPRHVVEEQMKDVGALGYASREVEVFYILKRKVFFKLGEYDHRNFLGYNWRKVNEELNEMELK